MFLPLKVPFYKHKVLSSVGVTCVTNIISCISYIFCRNTGIIHKYGKYKRNKPENLLSFVILQ